ncbi:hypothetical protein HPP92_020287 [Vanilla planifolia]|uniref:4a-hydroxytetrahydrobiopterin dehydratase n=1 Tax=Vanilla planifolia TaxID=51239 RepID=A0A835Q2S6_VANPL|nr:hypothetical protein HPP92_020689 [Vanilla planifolia]KAG0461811.1 hypothetical protein HPP92_020287 [Vanilla planifolia]
MAMSSLSSIPFLCSCSARLLPTNFLSSFSSFPPPASTVLFSRWMSGRKGGHCIRAMAPDLLGDLGARDPFPQELESNFGEKVLGNVNTEHRILIPNLAVLSLAERSCQAIPSSQPPLPKEEVEKLLKKIVGWRLVESDEGLKIQCTWRVRDYGCAVKLISRIYGAIETSGHYPDLHLEQTNQIRAELWTSSIGGLSLNDFIIAAKIDRIQTLDLAPKKRIWA